jgi:hypothetical protein
VVTCVVPDRKRHVPDRKRHVPDRNRYVPDRYVPLPISCNIGFVFLSALPAPASDPVSEKQVQERLEGFPDRSRPFSSLIAVVGTAVARAAERREVVERREARGERVRGRPLGRGYRRGGGAPWSATTRSRRHVHAGVVEGGRGPRRGPCRSGPTPSTSAIRRSSSCDIRIDGWHLLIRWATGYLRQALPRRPLPSPPRRHPFSTLLSDVGVPATVGGHLPVPL